MDLEQRLKQLEGFHDWGAIVEVLEQGILTSEDATQKADYHLRLGRLLYSQFLQGVRALKHFQDAYKLNPAHVDALSEARAIYWELGKLNMVQKLLELQLKNTQDAALRIELFGELGDIYFDLGDYDRAAQTYAKAIESSNGAGSDLPQRLLDAQVGDSEWQERIAGLLRNAHETSAPAEKALLLLRAARIARRFAPGEVEGILSRAYSADPSNANVAALYEGLLVEAQRTDAILETQREALKAAGDSAVKAGLAYDFGARWALRHQNSELGAQLLEESLRIDPAREQAFTYLKDLHGARGGEWEKLIRLVDELTDRSSLSPQAAYLLSQAGIISWKQRGDMVAARRFFERLARIEPENQALLAFEAQIGETLARREPEAIAQNPRAAAAASAPTPVTPPVAEPTPLLSSVQEPPLLSNDPVPETAPSAPPPASAVVAAADQGVVGELREKLRQQEAAKRYHEYVKTLLALGDALADPVEREELYSKAADLYATKFANQAEAVKAYEKVLEVNPHSPDAIRYLREMYEKRRDWEKLIQLGIREAETLPSGAERAERFKQIAGLATERVKKPEVCIQLWSVVLENDPYDLDALNALSQLYDRSREYGKLADVLQQLAELTDDVPQKVELLNKLGQVAGDRLKDEERAVDAYRQLLALEPSDRRAQEQLKKRYVTLGRWDDLEVFYAESGKWDEFIRVLESNETRATDTAQRIGMLMKIAELWVTQKGKLDRAARAYEKVLSIDQDNLQAAERLMPIYAGANNAKGLSSAIEVKLAHVREPEERLGLLREAANLYETRLNDRPKAFERYLAAFELASGDAQSQADVERAAQAIGTWDEVIRAYRSAVARAEKQRDLLLAGHLRLRLGRVLVEEVSLLDDALVEYRTVYDADPDNATALAALERLYRQGGRWSELQDVYAKKRELATSADERRTILFEIARLQEQQLGDPARAIETYAAMLEEAPDDSPALAALDRLYRSTEDWERYAEVLRRRIELESEVLVLVDLKYRLAETQQQKLSDQASALENFREILFLDPDHPGSRGALEGMLKNKKLRGEAASILEGIYEARGDWEKLLDALEILAAASTDRERRVQLLRKIAATASAQLGALDRAVEAQARALKEDPSIAESRDELEALAERAGAWEAVIGIYGEVAGSVRDPELARQYWMRLAAIEEHRGMVEEAAKSYERLLSANPSDDEALAALDALYRRTGHWDELIGVFRRRIELTLDASERESLYAQMAEIYDQKLGKPDEAIAAYREVLALDPTSQLALSALDALFTRLRMWDDLAENLETQLGLADTDEGQLSLMLRLALLREREMRQVDVAIEGYRQVIERDPENEQALAALERLGQDPAYSLSIAEILEPLYRGKSDYQRLIGVYEVQVARADDPTRKVELLHQIAPLYEDAAGNTNAAFDTMARALAVDPASEATQQQLDRLARATGRFQDLAHTFEQLAAAQREAEVASVLYASAARVFENDVGSADRAIELYRKVLSIDPANLAAAESLEVLFQSAERYADMSQILQRKAEILDRRRRQEGRAVPGRHARGRGARAAGGGDRRLHQGARHRRRGSAQRRRADQALPRARALGRAARSSTRSKADLVADPEEKKLISTRSARSTSASSATCRARSTPTRRCSSSIRTTWPRSAGSTCSIRPPATGASSSASCSTRPSSPQDPAEAVSYQYRIAELYEKHLDDIDRAVELYREILNVRSGSRADAQRARRHQERRSRAARPRLRCSSRSTKRWASGRSSSACSRCRCASPTTRSRRWSCSTASRGCTRRASAITLARSRPTRGRSSVDNQNEESLGALERLAMLIERWPAVAELYDRGARQARRRRDPERFVELGLRVAQIYEMQLEDVDDAVARYRRVLVVDPENQSAVRALDRSVHADRALAPIWRRSSRARPRSGRRPTRSSSSSTASVRSTRPGSAISTRAIAPTAR